MQVGTRPLEVTLAREPTSSALVGSPAESAIATLPSIPLSPDAGTHRPTKTQPTNVGALASMGLKVGAAVLGVMIGAAALTGCSSSTAVYRGPGYADYHRATLTWEVPTSHTDGSPFRDENGDGRIDGVRGFIVSRGDQPFATAGSYDEHRDVTSLNCRRNAGRTLCTYVWENLPSGTNYFAVKAFKEVTPGSRSISDYSNEASKVIP